MRRASLWLVVGVVLAACASDRPKPPPERPPGVGDIALRFAQTELGRDQRLDVSIAVFGAAEGDAATANGSARRAVEANYVSYQLRETLHATGLWADVRVLPKPDPQSELQIIGTLLASDGTSLRMRVQAYDGSGRQWLDKEYLDYADDRDYAATAREPFNHVYHAIANDLALLRESTPPNQLKRVQDIALVRYAAALAPDAFKDYASTSPEGLVTLNRLPAISDPMLRRVERIRESEDLFVETVDDHYGALFRSMRRRYTLWRRYDYEQSEALRGYVERRRRRPEPEAGSTQALERAYDNFREAKYWQETLDELAASFESAVAPTAIEAEGEVLELSGSLEQQYVEWRALLRKIFSAETGFAPQ